MTDQMDEWGDGSRLGCKWWSLELVSQGAGLDIRCPAEQRGLDPDALGKLTDGLMAEVLDLLMGFGVDGQAEVGQGES